MRLADSAAWSETKVDVCPIESNSLQDLQV